MTSSYVVKVLPWCIQAVFWLGKRVERKSMRMVQIHLYGVALLTRSFPSSLSSSLLCALLSALLSSPSSFSSHLFILLFFSFLFSSFFLASVLFSSVPFQFLVFCPLISFLFLFSSSSCFLLLFILSSRLSSFLLSLCFFFLLTSGTLFSSPLFSSLSFFCHPSSLVFILYPLFSITHTEGFYIPSYLSDQYPSLYSYQVYTTAANNTEVVDLFRCDKQGMCETHKPTLWFSSRSYADAARSEALLRNIGMDFYVNYTGSEPALDKVMLWHMDRKLPVIFYSYRMCYAVWVVCFVFASNDR